MNGAATGEAASSVVGRRVHKLLPGDANIEIFPVSAVFQKFS